MKAVFVDSISLASMLGIARLGRSVETIWHFEPVAPTSGRFIGLFRRLGLIRATVRLVENYIGQAQSDKEHRTWTTAQQQAPLDITSAILEAEVRRNPSIEHLSNRWPKDKVLHFFRQLITPEIHRHCLRVALASWIGLTQQVSPQPSLVLMIRRDRWFSYLEPYARERGIRLIGYRRWRGPAGGIQPVLRLLRTCRKRLPGLLPAVTGLLLQQVMPGTAAVNSLSVNGNHPSPRATIAVESDFHKLSFDPTERTPLFWLDGSGIPYSEVLVYDYASSAPLDQETSSTFKERGVRVFGWGPGIPSWRPTPRSFTMFLGLVFSLGLSVIKIGAKGKWVSAYYIKSLIILARDYSYWRDFYSVNKVGINVSTNVDLGVAQILALDDLDATSVGYQFSVALDYAAPALSNGENVQCVFSSAFEPVYRRMGAPVGRYLHTGFVYDSALHAVRQSGRSEAVREQLRHKGAEFVLCYFDENSYNTWTSPYHHQDTAKDYAFLLQWLLDDPSMGMVFKPKRSENLFQRLSSISQLIGRAQSTGRCKFLLSEHHSGSIYPSEAALAADVCVGLLSAPTAAFEARLAGIPTLLIDTHLEPDHPILAWGRGRVVFDDWPSIRAGVEQYRTSPESHAEFGDWRPGIGDFDPFQDGQGTLRMGQFIRWVYDAKKLGESKNDALEFASRMFCERWGDGHLTRGSGQPSGENTSEEALSRASGPL